MARGAGDFDFEQWFIEFACSAEANRIIRGMSRRYGLRPHEADDARQHWVMRVHVTLRGSGVPSYVVDEEHARRYVLLAARNALIDLSTRGAAAHEDVMFESDDMAYEFDRAMSSGMAPPSSVSEQVEAAEWCEQARIRITHRYNFGGMRCDGCRAGHVTSLALHVVNTVCDTEDHQGVLEEWTAELKGGTSPFGQLIYQAMSQVVPDRMKVDSDGRVAQSTRKLKSRCEPCVAEALLDAISVSHTEDEPVLTQVGQPDRTDDEHA